MKKLILAISATVFSLAVHAVTVNWNTDVDWGDIQWHQKVISEGGKITQAHITAGAKWALRLNMRFSKGVPTSGCLLMLGRTLNGGGTGGIMLSLSENGLTASLTDENHTATFSGTATLEMGLNQIVLAVDRRGAGTDYQALVSVFVNG